MSVIRSLGGEKHRELLRPALRLLFLPLWAINLPPACPSPLALPPTLPGRNQRSTQGGCKLAERRRGNGDVLSDSVFSFLETLPSCQLFVIYFFFLCIPLFLPGAATDAPSERNHVAVMSLPCHTSTSLNSSLMKRGDGLYCSQGVIYWSPPSSPHPHTHTHYTHLHLPFISSVPIRSAAICSFICSSPGWPGYFIGYHMSGRLSFLVEVESCLRRRSVCGRSQQATQPVNVNNQIMESRFN